MGSSPPDPPGLHARVSLLSRREWWSILLLLAVGLGIRLVGISQPFVDEWSWRQSDVAMIAENFSRHGFNFLYPEINWAGPAGYVGTEFPLVPLLAAVFYQLCGVQDWVGRAISVGFFLLSVPCVYLLVKQMANTTSAFLAVGIYLVMPLSIFLSREFMPDMAALSCSLMALTLFSAWLTHQAHSRLLVAATGATCLALLLKITYGMIGVPLLYLAWQTYGVKVLHQRKLWACAAVSLTIPVLWYAHAYGISRAYVPYHFFGEGGIALGDLTWYGTILSRVVLWSLTPPVVGAMVLGALCPGHGTFRRLFHWWLLAYGVLMIVTSYGHRHQWYQLPVVPVAAAFGGIFWETVLQWGDHAPWASMCVRMACLAFFGVTAALSYHQLQPRYDPWAVPLWQAGQALDRLAPPEALVLAADGGDPTLIYYSRRKGWHFPEIAFHGHDPIDSQAAIVELEARRRNGATYLVLTAYTVWWLDHYPAFRDYLESHYPRVQETRDYLIYALAGKTPP
jgi:4-amino-4-deoxy-L-arabinose transferase-like glycosyltransferase